MDPTRGPSAYTLTHDPGSIDLHADLHGLHTTGTYTRGGVFLYDPRVCHASGGGSNDSRDQLTAALLSLADPGASDPRCGDPVDHFLWLSDDPTNGRFAAEWCVGRPILAECAASADAHGEQFGVFGGTDRTKITKAGRPPHDHQHLAALPMTTNSGATASQTSRTRSANSTTPSSPRSAARSAAHWSA